VLGQHEVPGIEDAAEPLSDSDKRWGDLGPAVGIAAALLIALANVGVHRMAYPGHQPA
jgi:hypothetical protein